MECYSDIKKKKGKIMPFAATWLDLEICILSEISLRKVEYDIAYIWNIKKCYKRMYLQNRSRVTGIENKLDRDCIDYKLLWVVYSFSLY